MQEQVCFSTAVAPGIPRTIQSGFLPLLAPISQSHQVGAADPPDNGDPLQRALRCAAGLLGGFGEPEGQPAELGWPR